MEVKVIWKQNLAFDGSGVSGITIPLDTSPDEGGGSGLRPMELIAIGTAGCTAMDVISILNKKKQKVTAFEVRIQYQRAETHPKVFTQMEIEYVVTGKQVDPAAVSRAIELSETKYCSAIGTLKNSVSIQHRFTIVEAE